MKTKNFPLKKNLRKKLAVTNLKKAAAATNDEEKRVRIQKAIDTTAIEDDGVCRSRRSKKRRTT